MVYHPKSKFISLVVKTFIKCIFLSGYFITSLVWVSHRGHQDHPSDLEMGKLRLTEGKRLAQEWWGQKQDAGSQAASLSGPAWGFPASPRLESFLLSTVSSPLSSESYSKLTL